MLDAAIRRIYGTIEGKLTNAIGIFREHDVDKSGALDQKEVQACLKQMGVRISPRAAELVLKRFDDNYDGSICVRSPQPRILITLNS